MFHAYRGLVGYRSVFSSDTRGTGFMHCAFQGICFFFFWSSLCSIHATPRTIWFLEIDFCLSSVVL